MSAITKFYKPGRVLFEEGDIPTIIYIIRQGEVSIRKANDKSFIEIAKVKTGEVIGELSFFDRQPRSATAITINEVELIEITFSDFEKIYAAVPDYLKTIIAALAERLRDSNEQIKALQGSKTLGSKRI